MTEFLSVEGNGAPGSQCGTVFMVLPGPESTLLTRKMLYNATPRAQHHLRIIGIEDATRASAPEPYLSPNPVIDRHRI
jgi:hypothetical protein